MDIRIFEFQGKILKYNFQYIPSESKQKKSKFTS